MMGEGATLAGLPGGPQVPSGEPGSSLRVFLLTIGRGERIWERFGHNALWIQDEASGQGAAYNWGIFDFQQVDFVPRLIRGTMLYRMAPYDPWATVEEARREGRRVWIQELDLTPSQKLDLLAFVQWNARPENRDYRYDYYRDNCSTRVRDALDRVLDGALRAATEGLPTPHSYRWHTRRLLSDVPLAYLGVQFVLGPAADLPLNAWQEMFLPVRLMERIREVRVSAGGGPPRPLVVQERLLVESSRLPEPDRPPRAFPWFLAAGLLGSVALWAGIRQGSVRGGVWRGLGALVGAVWCGVAGFAGTLLLGAWLFTDHVFWYRNLNLLQASPLALVMAGAFLPYLRGGRMPRWGRDLAAALAVMAWVGALMGAFPPLRQGNLELLLLTLPMNTVLWVAAHTVVERRLRPRSGSEGGGGLPSPREPGS